MGRIVISEQQVSEQGSVYHWTILDENGNVYSRSAYHTDREACEREGQERLDDARAAGTI